MAIIISPEVPPQVGGIATYVGTVQQAMPEVRVAKLRSLGYGAIVWTLVPHRREEWWVQHILPVGTVAWMLRGKYRIFLHGMDWDLARRSPWKQWLSTKILKGATEVVVNSRALRREVLEEIPGLRVRVVHPTLAPETLAAGLATPPRSTEEHRGLVSALTVCRLVERKGVQNMLQALVKVPNVHLTVVGDGPYRKTLEALAATLGVAPRVTFVGALQGAALHRAYAEADMFVFTPTLQAGTREGFGIVLLEAAAFGLPIVMTQQPGMMDAIKANAILVADQTEAIAQAMKELAADPARRYALGETGRRWVSAYGTLDRVRAEFLQTTL